jgi:hypothetical protein
MWMRVLFGASWGAAGALLVRLGWAWRNLPDRVAVHFNWQREPDKWVSRRGFALIMAALFVLLAILGVAASLTVSRPGTPLFPVVVMAASVGALVATFWQVIRFNETSRPIHVGWFLAPVAVVLAFVVFALLR